MPANFATKLAEGFAKRVLKIYFEEAVADEITNKDYEGEVKDKMSKLNILTFAKMTLKNYTGANLTADTPQESVATLVTDQQKAYYFAIKSLDTFKSWIDNPEGTLIDQNGSLLQEAIDAYVLSFWADAASGNWIGTDYVTGTVTVTVTTGAVVGVGTTFTAGMVGKPFKAVGHSKWYRITGFTNGTNIVISNDSDDEAVAYDGGAIAGAAYVIQANTPLALTKTNIYAYVVQCGIKLDQAKAPKKGRFIVFPSQAKVALNAAPELIPAVPAAYGEVIKNGRVGMIDGMNVYVSEQVAGDNTAGYNVLFGHKSFITMAMGFVESGTEDLIGNFGKAYKGLTVYGGKVADERRKMGGTLFATFA